MPRPRQTKADPKPKAETNQGQTTVKTRPALHAPASKLRIASSDHLSYNPLRSACANAMCDSTNVHPVITQRGTANDNSIGSKDPCDD